MIAREENSLENLKPNERSQSTIEETYYGKDKKSRNKSIALSGQTTDLVFKLPNTRKSTRTGEELFGQGGFMTETN